MLLICHKFSKVTINYNCNNSFCGKNYNYVELISLLIVIIYNDSLALENYTLCYNR